MITGLEEIKYPPFICNKCNKPKLISVQYTNTWLQSQYASSLSL